ncbi:MAG: hypothetical protein LBV12_11035 [Puniceicoccales bacterium]|jgi:hypothetical protein|nr:hypothetical protein [Puniceicoccales bacterium]
MPIYVYQIINPDGTEGEVFEIEQSLSDEALTTHPVTGQPVRRVFQPPNISGQYGERLIREQVTNADNLERLGFTRYQRDKISGVYYKTSGRHLKAPEVIDPKKLPAHPGVDPLFEKARKKQQGGKG